MIDRFVRCSDAGQIQFYNPTFRVASELSLVDSDSDIIYNGPFIRQMSDYLRDNTRHYISLSGSDVTAIDFSTPALRLRWVVSTLGLKVSEASLERLVNCTATEVDEHAKKMWVLRKWLAVREAETGMFELFKVLTNSSREAMDVYYRLAEEFTPELIKSALITFLVRVCSADEQGVGKGYRKLLLETRVKIGHRVRLAMANFAQRERLLPELAVFGLLSDLSGS